MKRFLLAGFAFAVVISFAGATGRQEDQPAVAGHTPVTLTIIHEHTAEAAARMPSSAGFLAMIKKFKEEHPWVTVEETALSTPDLTNKSLALIAANDLPDVPTIKYAWIRNMVAGGMLADLTPYAKPDLYVDNLYSMTYKGKVYGLPNKYTVYNLVFYNTKMWKDAGYDKFPGTIDELIKAGAAFKAKGKDTLAFGDSGKWFAPSLYASALVAAYCGSDWLSTMQAGTGGKWTDQRFVDAMKKLREMSVLFNKDCITQDDMWALGWYIQGNAAATVSGGWAVDTLGGLGKDHPDVWNNTRVTIFPSATDKDPVQVAAVPVGVGVNSKLKGPAFDAAVQLCQQISSMDYARFMAERASTTPIKIAVDFSGRGIQYQDFAHVLNSYKTSLDMQTYFNQGLITQYQADLQNLILGTMTAEQLAADLQHYQDSNIKQ